MSDHRNELGQPIGFPMCDWRACPMPTRIAMPGRFCRLEPLALQHAEDLFAAFADDPDGRLWTYMAIGPFADLDALKSWIDGVSDAADPLFYALVDAGSGKAAGFASYMRIDPANGVIEVGSIVFAPALQKTWAATEAMYLMMKRAFEELGYRRYEWKCDHLNAASEAAARRYGFRYEGLFRQAVVYKNRNRDTAWFSVTDTEWPALKAAFEAWLAPGNQDSRGAQIRRLAELRTS